MNRVPLIGLQALAGSRCWLYCGYVHRVMSHTLCHCAYAVTAMHMCWRPAANTWQQRVTQLQLRRHLLLVFIISSFDVCQKCRWGVLALGVHVYAGVGTTRNASNESESLLMQSTIQRGLLQDAGTVAAWKQVQYTLLMLYCWQGNSPAIHFSFITVLFTLHRAVVHDWQSGMFRFALTLLAPGLQALKAQHADSTTVPVPHNTTCTAQF